MASKSAAVAFLLVISRTFSPSIINLFISLTKSSAPSKISAQQSRFSNFTPSIPTSLQIQLVVVHLWDSREGNVVLF